MKHITRIVIAAMFAFSSISNIYAFDIDHLNKIIKSTNKILLTEIINEGNINTINKKRISLVYARFADERMLFVGRPSKGKCCITLLVNDKETEARQLYGITFDPRIMDLDKNGISEIEIEDYISGQGIEVIHKMIINIDNWQPVILHKAVAKSNSGIYDKSDKNYLQESIKFEYIDFDGDGLLDLAEKWKVETSKEIKLNERIYLFTDQMFSQKKTVHR